MQAAKTPPLALGLAMLALAGACGPASTPAPKPAAAPPEASEQGYRPPPELTGVEVGPGGRLQLSGTASPGVAVRLATPAGQAAFANADAHGQWSLSLPASAAPRLLSLSMTDSGRLIQAMGYLFVAPDGEAARLRAGGGSETLRQGSRGLAAEAIDYDGQRAVTLCGRANPAEAVSLRVDGVERARAVADGSGRFVLPLNQPLGPGAHDFDLASSSAQIEFTAPIGAPARLTGAPFQASRSALGWRVDWLTPGGGEQTTLLLNHPEPAA